MRLDNELLSGPSVVLSKHDSPRFRYMKDNVNIDEQDIIKIKKGVFTNLQKIENNETRLASKINDKDEILNTPKHQGAMIVDVLSHGTENETTCSVSPCKTPSSKVKRCGTKDICTAKLIMPSELPELSIYYKNAANAVKDICVDEQVLVKDKITIMNETDKSGGIKVPPNKNENDPMTKESDIVEFLSLDGSSKSSENDYEKPSREIKCSPGSTVACDNTSGVSSQKTLKSFLLSSDYNSTDFDQSTNKIPSSGGMHGNPATGLAYSSNMGCRTTAPEYNSCKLVCEGGNEAQQGESESRSLIDGPSSGRITYSGHMLIYSGSVSIRSDSSSTRSFAFPILQPEWDSSPVQMGISGKRQQRKQRGWKQALVCFHFAALPRKLRLMEDTSTLHTTALSSNDKSHSYHHPSGSLSGKIDEEVLVGTKHTKEVTLQEHQLDHADKSSFFTMDYSHVRKRRPIHNQSTNIGP